eukprot:8459856-Prorocentrum_lima.AAC.1
MKASALQRSSLSSSALVASRATPPSSISNLTLILRRPCASSSSAALRRLGWQRFAPRCASSPAALTKPRATSLVSTS